MLQKLIDLKDYLVNDWNMSGWKIRMVARAHMGNALFVILLYTWWLFSLPKNWDPELEGQGPFGPRHFRIFCFFIYNISLFINCGQFFNGLLLYGCIDQGIKEKDITMETTQFYVIFSFVLNVINGLKFGLLYFYLDYDLTFSLIMSAPEILMHTAGIFMVIFFTFELRKMVHFEDKSTYSIGKNGKIIFD